MFTANARKPWDVISEEIKDCDFYILLIGGRYGSYCEDEDVSDKKISFTHREFEYADSLGKPIITFIHKNWRDLPQDIKHIDWERENDRADHTKQDKLDKFIALARDNKRRSSAQWSNSNELKYEVQRAIINQISAMKETDGWIRANQFISHASKTTTKDTLTSNDDYLTFDDSQEVKIFIETLLSFSDDSLRIKHMKQCSYTTHINVLKDEEFVFFLISEIDINKHTYEYISKIIEFVCYTTYLYPFSERIKDYFKQLNYNSLIDLLHIGTEHSYLFKSTTELIKKFNMSTSAPIPNTIIKSLQQHYADSNIKLGCINILEDFTSGINHKWLVNELCVILKSNDSTSSILPLTIEEAISLFVNVLDDVDFEIFCDVYATSEHKKMLAEYFISNHTYTEDGGVFSLRKPKFQHLFFNFCNSVYSLNDDELTANMFSYCLFFRTQDIYSVDEILEDAVSLNDDAFYLFIQNFDEFLWEYINSYVKQLMSNIDKKKVIQIIKKRHHPREKKLIQIINDKYNWLKEIVD